MKVLQSDVHVVKTETRSFEIVEMNRAKPETIEEYSGVKDNHGVPGYIRPLGAVTLKYWDGPGDTEEDLTDDEEEPSASVNAACIAKETFWLEDAILEHCFVGMKLTLVVHELNIGIKYFDRIEGAYCSFHTILPNEKLAHWKEPVPNTRPPPTEDDPDLEDKFIDAMIARDAAEDEKGPKE